jgi:hypothetical protein
VKIPVIHLVIDDVVEAVDFGLGHMEVAIREILKYESKLSSANEHVSGFTVIVGGVSRVFFLIGFHQNTYLL